MALRLLSGECAGVVENGDHEHLRTELAKREYCGRLHLLRDVWIAIWHAKLCQLQMKRRHAFACQALFLRLQFAA